MQSAVIEMIQNWLTARPMLDWAFAHPIWTSVGFAILLVLLGGLLRAIAQLTEQLWVRLLQLPMRVGRWILAQLFQLFRLPFRSPAIADLEPANTRSPAFNLANLQDDSESPVSEQQLCDILVRLEHLQQEQTLLLQDIKRLISAQERSKSGRKTQIMLH
ncbi:hypothetical protein [Altericista sp. CCNU0014]|uniref:hypothetical protein n=1 Tax=Altericista sp. CCNU0014 TaxID=3082949 RepID=UPI00384EC1B9